MATERSSRESGGTGNAGAGAGRGGRDVGGQRDSRGRDSSYKGSSQGSPGGARRGKGSAAEDAALARQIDVSKNLPGGRIGGTADDTQGPGGIPGPEASFWDKFINNLQNPTLDPTFNAWSNVMMQGFPVNPMAITAAMNALFGQGDISNTGGGSGIGGNGEHGPDSGLTVNPDGTVTPSTGGTGGTPIPGGVSKENALAAALAGIRGKADNSSLYYLQQRGIVPTSATAIPDEWKSVFDREFGRIKNTLPNDLFTDSMMADNQIDPSELSSLINQLQTYYPTEFGNNALTAEEQRRQNTYKTGLDTAGYRNSLSSAFGDTADDDIINQIYQEQYDPAAQMLQNQFKRGALNQSGYNYAMNRLNTTGAAGKAKLQDIGSQQRAATSSDISKWLDDIYGKAGSTSLTGTFDPNSYATELTNRINTGKANLQNKITESAPNIFDTSTITRDAGTVQGVTNRGSLLDTIAARNASRTPKRGIGTTGVF